MPEGSFQPDMTEIRLHLWHHGWTPVPITSPHYEHPSVSSPGKQPFIKNWTSFRADKLTLSEIQRWVYHQNHPGTGILTGVGGLIAVDIDVTEPDLAARLQRVAAVLLGSSPFLRIGRSPKALLLYRVAGEPTKLATKELWKEIAGKAQIEILGMGQQFVAFGIHPTTKQPYAWPNKSPLEASPSDVPEISEDAVKGFVVAAEGILRGAGYTTVQDSKRSAAEGTKSPIPFGIPSALAFPPSTREEVEAALNATPNTHDWSGWVKIGAAIFHALGDSGEELFLGWSAKSNKNNPEATKAKWNSFRTSPMNQVTAATLFGEARDNGWKPTKPVAKVTDICEVDARKKPVDAGLPVVWFKDIELATEAKDFVQGLLAEQSSVVVYGESNAGKTFWTTDLALHIAVGRPWNGRRVDQGGVIYCALEGGAGFRNRVVAWRAKHCGTDVTLPFAAIPASLDLLAPDTDTPRLIAAITDAASRIQVPVKLIVIDTLSRALAGGNENASEDMGALVRNMDLIREKTGACVLFIHHSGKDQARGARGHSLLRAAIDTEIEVRANEGNGHKTATVMKQREMSKDAVFGFTLEVVVLGKNQHGEEVTTCLVIEQPAKETATSRRTLTLVEQGWLRDLNDIFAAPTGPEKRVPVPGMTPVLTMTREQVRLGLKNKGRFSLAPDGTLTGADRERLRSTLNSLKDKGKVGLTADFVWLL